MSPSAALIAVVIVAAALSRQQAPAPPQAVDHRTPAYCPVSDDPTYGVTRENPVQVGGGAMFGQARERRFLEALRGPGGQPVRYKRVGSTAISNTSPILDGYEVTYEGLEKPAVVYIDEYHFGELRAPRGFVCGQPIALGPPPADPFQTSEAIISVAAEQGANRDFAPIPLGHDGSTTHGIAFDHFRMVARAARAASAAGSRLDPRTIPADVSRTRTVILAFPLTCDGRTAAPAAIDIVDPQANAARREGDYARNAAISALLPGVQAPASSLAAIFTLATLRASDTVRITYADAACTGGATEVSLPVKYSPPRTLDTPAPALPAGAAPADAPVRLQALVDLDGSLQRATYMGGPGHLVRAAIDAVSRWRSEPPRVNGAPVARGVILQVTFRP
jgi:hypothetical protein